MTSMRAAVNLNSMLCRRHRGKKRPTSKFTEWETGSWASRRGFRPFGCEGGYRQGFRGSLASLLLAALIAVSLIQSPAQELRDFHHTAWSSDSQMGAVDDIQQSPDGYLWLTTSKGVFRFDGVHFQSADEITSGATQHIELASAFVSASGDVWFRTQMPDSLLWRDGKLSAYPIKGCTPGLLTGSTVEDREGKIWVAGSAGLFIIGEGKCERVSEQYGLPAGFPAAIVIDGAGTLWAIMASGKLLYLPRGGHKFKVSPYHGGPVGDFAYLHEGPEGSVWLSDAQGLRRVSGPGVDLASQQACKVARPARFGNFTFDRDGTPVGGERKGIARFPNVSRLPMNESVDAAAGQYFTIAQGLSSDVVWKILVDREGSLWVGTNSGLDKLRRNVISRLAIPARRKPDGGLGGTMAASGLEAEVCRSPKCAPMALQDVCRDWAVDPHPAGFPRGRLVVGVWPGSDFGGPPAMGLSQCHTLGTMYRWRFGGARQEQRPLAPDVWPECVSAEGPGLGKREQDTGQRTRRTRFDGRGSSGKVWLVFRTTWSNGMVPATSDTPIGGKNRFPTCLMVKGTHVWLGAEDGVQLLTQGQFRMMRWRIQAHLDASRAWWKRKAGIFGSADFQVSRMSGLTR